MKVAKAIKRTIEVQGKVKEVLMGKVVCRIIN